MQYIKRLYVNVAAILNVSKWRDLLRQFHLAIKNRVRERERGGGGGTNEGEKYLKINQEV